VLCDSKVISWKRFSRWLRLFLNFKEFSCVVITVINSYLFSKNLYVFANVEIKRKKRESTSILSKDLASLQKIPLWDATISFTRLYYHYCVVFKIVLNNQLSDTEVLKAAFNNGLFKVSVESQYLL